MDQLRFQTQERTKKATNPHSQMIEHVLNCEDKKYVEFIGKEKLGNIEARTAARDEQLGKVDAIKNQRDKRNK